MRFADSVFAILIIEDVVAVGILVALSTMMTQGEIEGLSLVMLVVRLVFIVGTWLLIGFFIVPRILRIAARSGSDELLTVLALGLCLILVVFASHFGYSPDTICAPPRDTGLLQRRQTDDQPAIATRSRTRRSTLARRRPGTMTRDRLNREIRLTREMIPFRVQCDCALTICCQFRQL